MSLKRRTVPARRRGKGNEAGDLEKKKQRMGGLKCEDDGGGSSG